MAASSTAMSAKGRTATVDHQTEFGHNPSVGIAMKFTIKRTLHRKVRKCREQALTVKECGVLCSPFTALRPSKRLGFSAPFMERVGTIFGGDKVCDLLGLQQESMRPLLQEAIRLGDTLMLAQVLQPRFDEECFHEAARFGRIFEDPPSESAISAALGRYAL